MIERPSRYLRPAPPGARSRASASTTTGLLNPAQLEAVDDHRGTGAGGRRRRQRQDPHPGVPRRPPGRAGHRSAGASCCSPSPARPPPRCCAAPPGCSTAAASRSPAAPSTPSPTSCCAATAARSACRARFTILDRGDAEDVIGLLRARLGLDKKEKRFPRKQTIAEMFSMAVNKSRPLRDLIEDAYSHLARARRRSASRCRPAYAAYKAERQVLDYDDLLVKLHELLREHPRRARAAVAQRYRYIMVDEYQDTNPLQARDRAPARRRARQRHGGRRRRAEHLRLPRRRLPQHHGFPRRSSPARASSRLEQNYRSTQPILDVANAVISAGARALHQDPLHHASRKARCRC